MPRPRRPALIVHGGAGRYATADRAPAKAGCLAAARAGWHILDAGGSALDAVQAAVIALEDDPQFNAGTGATLNSSGEVELDASIMEGATLRAGAVAAVRRIKNPITLARRILDDGRHVLLAGAGAERFAHDIGVPACDEESLVVPRQKQRWRERHGTVGAVAVDARGQLAAATSTGGIFDKRPGRVGDSAIIGAGTYADRYGAVSCTGTGEAIMRVTLARAATEFLAADATPQMAARRAIQLLQARTGADGGLIVIDRLGRLGYARNTPAMVTASIAGGREASDI